ncbi:uncharacterized protein LOC110181160 [Drosophila serrata]|uniref:uncharacterized protein LOC110181160 n=1 Tax=Drosophila serrata TaxID=7274 RepID=UPI000A1D02E3|nr:uncharacterized protein LOC110181160 [Drosophila serrata]
MVQRTPHQIGEFLNDLTMQNFSSLMYPKGCGWSPCNVPLCHPYACDHYMGIFDRRGNLRDPTHPWSLNKLLQLLQRVLNNDPLTGMSMSQPYGSSQMEGESKLRRIRQDEKQSRELKSGQDSNINIRNLVTDLVTGKSKDRLVNNTDGLPSLRNQKRSKDQIFASNNQSALISKQLSRISFKVIEPKDQEKSNKFNSIQKEQKVEREPNKDITYFKDYIADKLNYRHYKTPKDVEDDDIFVRGFIHHVDSYFIRKAMYMRQKPRQSTEVELIIRNQVEQSGNMVDADDMANAIRLVKFEDPPQIKTDRKDKNKVAMEISQMYTDITAKKTHRRGHKYIAEQVPILFHAPFDENKPWTWQHRHPGQLRVTAENKIGNSHIKRYHPDWVKNKLIELKSKYQFTRFIVYEKRRNQCLEENQRNQNDHQQVHSE